ncbi:type II toxin-antitoxin system VapC family toxin [Pseudonocardia eucalypti]|uniref:Ribonuclease VapC n=1 Tax=Pseudonocardia eucalypti TaxID=648755 RepID=A0ABP9PG26_9PSEU|nr:toxin-antitoxin system PIN domain toxin [Pseudonocardia eucalypti]
MIAVDTNILVYAHRRDAEFHPAAARCVRDLAEGRSAWAIPWPCLHEFFAIATHPKIYDPPSTREQAITQLDAWLAAPTLFLLHESPDYWTRLKPLLLAGKVSGPMVHDARVATLCLTHGARELWTADRDFNRFGPLKTRNPLLGG